MKRIIILFILFLPFTSCDDFLEETPKDRLTEINFYQTKEDARAAVDASYTPLRNIFRTLYMLMVDIAADYADGRGSTQPLGNYTIFDQININRVGTMWTAFYQSIRNSNIAIERIQGMQDINDSEKNALIAEAKFVRAFSYYHLVRHWGAVPIVLESTAENTGRMPENQVYQTIIEDLQSGENQLPAIPAQFGRPTKWSAKALLAEVYLTMGQWSSAKEKSKEVIDAGVFELVQVNEPDDFDKIFGAGVNGTSEELWYIKYNHQDGSSWPMNLLWSETVWSPFGNYVIYSVPGPFFDNWDDDDLRKQFNIFTEYINRNTGVLETLPSSTPILCSKFRDPNSPARDGHANDLPVLRYADVLLIYAESSVLADNGVTDLALEYLNKIKRRAYGFPSNSVSPVDYHSDGWNVDSFRDVVLQERAYELYMEGKRWFDLKRSGKAKEIILANKGVTLQDAFMLWPIPQQEIDTNPFIDQSDQNPGY